MESRSVPGVKGRSGGRNAKTVSDHQLAGTFKKSRHKHIKNPEPPSGIPQSPKVLEGDALEEWQRMLVRLSESKTLSTADAGALYQYCRLFAETEAIAESQAAVRDSIDALEEAMVDFHEESKLQAFQELTKMLKLESGYTTQIRQGRMAQRVYLVEFGLTPASRSRVKVTNDAPPDVDEFDVPARTH